MVEELTSFDVVHYEVYTVALLKHKVHSNDERVLQSKHYHFFKLGILNQVFFNQVILVEALDGVVLFGGGQKSQKDLTKGAS